MGNNAWATIFPGIIDDVRIYNRALSPTEVQQLYHLGTATILPNFQEL
jgi:Concanavalin A-like lectin/glucanases superfamily